MYHRGARSSSMATLVMRSEFILKSLFSHFMLVPWRSSLSWFWFQSSPGGLCVWGNSLWCCLSTSDLYLLQPWFGVSLASHSVIRSLMHFRFHHQMNIYLVALAGPTVYLLSCGLRQRSYFNLLKHDFAPFSFPA